jgi:hypothetical protein
MVDLLQMIMKPRRHTSSTNGLPNIYGLLVWDTVEHVYPGLSRCFVINQRVFRTGFQYFYKLVSEGFIDIKDKFMSITYNDTSIPLRKLCNNKAHLTVLMQQGVTPLSKGVEYAYTEESNVK